MLAAIDEQNSRGSGGKGPQSASFGPFEIRLDTGELRKHGVRVRLQTKPFQILRALLEEAGRVVTREELRGRLWSTDTFVDFESGLNTAVNRLRTALADSAESPVYIETLSRIGYRFIAPVVFSGHEIALPPEEPAIPEESANSEESATKELAQNGQVHRPLALPEKGLAEKMDAIYGPPLALKWTLVGLVLIGVAGGVTWAFRKFDRKEAPEFQQLTFSNGEICDARFAGSTGDVVYSAAWKGKPSRLFIKKRKTGETKDLGFEGAFLAGVSPKGDVALLFRETKSPDEHLFLAALSGGPLSPAPAGAVAIDWAPDGTEGLIIRQGTEYRVEYPPGRIVYRTRGWVDALRISPDGKRLAFLRHPVIDDDAGDVVVLEPGNQAQVLSAGWASGHGLAWSQSGKEILFTAARTGIDRQLMAVNLAGQTRRVAEVPGGISLHDAGKSGELLVTRDTSQMSMFRGQFKSHTSRDVSWLDWPLVEGISGDGKSILFDESADGGGREYSSYLYNAEAGSYRRVGAGRAMDLSTDGRWAVTQSARNPNSLTLISVLDGKCQSIATHGFFYRWARFLPGSDSELLIGGGYDFGDEGVFKQHVPGGTPVRVPVSAKLNSAVIDAGGNFIAGENSDGTISLIDLANRSARTIPNPNHLIPVAFMNANELLTWHSEAGFIDVQVLDLRTGAARQRDRIESEPGITPDVAGFLVSQDLQTYAYCRLEILSTLFSVRGWK